MHDIPLILPESHHGPKLHETLSPVHPHPLRAPRAPGTLRQCLDEIILNALLLDAHNVVIADILLAPNDEQAGTIRLSFETSMKLRPTILHTDGPAWSPDIPCRQAQKHPMPGFCTFADRTFRIQCSRTEPDGSISPAESWSATVTPAALRGAQPVPINHAHPDNAAIRSPHPAQDPRTLVDIILPADGISEQNLLAQLRAAFLHSCLTLLVNTRSDSGHAFDPVPFEHGAVHSMGFPNAGIILHAFCLDAHADRHTLQPDFLHAGIARCSGLSEQTAQTTQDGRTWIVRAQTSPDTIPDAKQSLLSLHFRPPRPSASPAIPQDPLANAILARAPAFLYCAMATDPDCNPTPRQVEEATRYLVQLPAAPHSLRPWRPRPAPENPEYENFVPANLEPIPEDAILVQYNYLFEPDQATLTALLPPVRRRLFHHPSDFNDFMPDWIQRYPVLKRIDIQAPPAATKAASIHAPHKHLAPRPTRIPVQFRLSLQNEPARTETVHTDLAILSDHRLLLAADCSHEPAEIYRILCMVHTAPACDCTEGYEASLAAYEQDAAYLVDRYCIGEHAAADRFIRNAISGVINRIPQDARPAILLRGIPYEDIPA